MSYTHLKTAFLAILRDQTDGGWLNTNPEELHQVLMLHLFHLS